MKVNVSVICRNGNKYNNKTCVDRECCVAAKNDPNLDEIIQIKKRRKMNEAAHEEQPKHTWRTIQNRNCNIITTN